MKKMTMPVLWLLAAVIVAGAYNYDDTCWAPGEEQGAGVGGGVITPGAGGGFGDGPDPEPRETRLDGRAPVPVVDCTCDTLPDITLACPFITTVQTSEEEGKEEGKVICALQLRVKMAALNPDPKAPVPQCSCATSAQTCTAAEVHGWVCAGKSTCKRGTSCKEAGEVWDGWCEYGPGKSRPSQVISAYTANDARQKVLYGCEDQLREDGGGEWFCMPGTIECVPGY